MQSGMPHDDRTTLHRTWHSCAWGATKGKYAVDAGGPSGEPPAGREIVPVWHRRCQTVVQAKEKLKFIEQEIEAARAAVVAKVGSGLPLVRQRSAM
jgi:hypothetical protein